eukprot:441630-Alexandrium_andersonii.AAC.1
MQPFYPLVEVSGGPKIQPEGAAVQARPTGKTALPSARNRRMSETPQPHCQAQEAPARSAAPPASGPAEGGLRISPIPSRGEGRWARR